MIKIGTVICGQFRRHETMEEALARYMTSRSITDDDVINLVPDRDNPHLELHIYYKERDF